MQNKKPAPAGVEDAFVGHVSRATAMFATAMGATSEFPYDAKAAVVIVAAIQRGEDGGDMVALSARWFGCGACISAALGQQMVTYVGNQALAWTRDGHECSGRGHAKG